MARTQVIGLNIQGRKQPLPINEESWGIHGPIQTKWVNRHVYWVVPLGTAIVLLLALGAFDAFDQKEVIKTILVPDSSQPTATQDQGMTTATVKAALAETETILSAAGRIAEQMKPSQEIVVRDMAPPPPAPLTTEPPKPEPPARRPSIWDLNR